MTGPAPRPPRLLAASTAAPSAARCIERVEVRKNPEATTWYDARLRDVVLGGRARVSFDGGVWPDREVPCTTVRPRPPPSSASGLAAGLRPGDRVEIRVAASDRNPCGWALGRALSVQDNGLVHVELEGRAPGSKALALRPDALRPASEERALDPLVLARRAVLVEGELRTWLPTPDARGCLEQVRSVAGLGLVGVGTDAAGICATGTADSAAAADAAAEAAAAAGRPAPELPDVQPDAVLLLGSDAAVRRGEMLLRVHMMHQQDMESFHRRRKQKLTLLQDLRDRAVGSGCRETFEVDANLTGRLCGKGGERIARVEKEFSVEVRIVDGADDAAPRMVHILGESEEAVERARCELELVRAGYPVGEEREEWMRSEAQEIAKRSGLVHAIWVDGALELCGQRRCIEDAVLLLDNHSDYFSVFQEMQRQKDEIKRSFDALSAAQEAGGLVRLGASRRAGSVGAPAAPHAEAAAAAPEREAPEEAASSGGSATGSPGRGRSGSRRGRGRGRGGAPAAPRAEAAAAAPEREAPEEEASSGGSAAGAPGRRSGSRRGRGRGRGGASPARGAALEQDSSPAESGGGAAEPAGGGRAGGRSGRGGRRGRGGSRGRGVDEGGREP